MSPENSPHDPNKQPPLPDPGYTDSVPIAPDDPTQPQPELGERHIDLDTPIPTPNQELSLADRMKHNTQLDSLISDLGRLEGGIGRIRTAAIDSEPRRRRQLVYKQQQQLKDLERAKRRKDVDPDDLPRVIDIEEELQRQVDLSIAKWYAEKRAAQNTIKEHLLRPDVDTYDLFTRAQRSHRGYSRAEDTYRAKILGNGVTDRGHIAAIDASTASNTQAQYDWRDFRNEVAAEAPVPLPGPDATKAQIDAYHKAVKKREAAIKKADNAHLTTISSSGGSAWKRTREHAADSAQFAAAEGAVDDLGEILSEVQKEYRERLNTIDSNVLAAQRHLAHWPLGEQAPADTLDTIISKQLATATENIDLLSQYDTARAERLEEIIRLRYRLEARSILTGNNSGRNARYTDDGGIAVNGDNVVIYEDGSAQRNENGWAVRRMANGEQHPADEPQKLTENPQHGAGKNLDQLRQEQATALRLWDAERSAQAADAAWNAVNAYAGRIEAGELGEVTQHLNRISANLDQQRAELEALRSEPAAEDATEEEKQERIRTIRGLEVSVANLAQMQSNMRRQTTQARTEINQARYWQALLEVGREVTHTEAVPQRQRRVGKIALGGRKNKPEDQEYTEVRSNRSAAVMPNGSVAWGNASLNGRVGNWIITPSGATVECDQNGTPIAHYRPDGKRA